MPVALKFAVILGVCSCLSVVSPAQDSTDVPHPTAIDYFSAENVRKFADFLSIQRDYLRAAGEYDRLRFVLGDGPAGDSAVFAAGINFLKGGDFGRCRERFRQILAIEQARPLHLDSRYYLARTAYVEAKWPDVFNYLPQPGDTADPRFRILGAAALLSITHARQGQWDRAEYYSCGQGGLLDERDKPILCSLAVEGAHLPLKSKTKAVLLSAVIPGLGKFYARRTIDGIFSLVTVGTAAWQSYRGFEEKGKSSAEGWIFGVMAGAFYLGNVYGSAVSVELYNRKVKDGYFHTFEAAVGLTLP